MAKAAPLRTTAADILSGFTSVKRLSPEEQERKNEEARKNALRNRVDAQTGLVSAASEVSLPFEQTRLWNRSEH